MTHADFPTNLHQNFIAKSEFDDIFFETFCSVISFVKYVKSWPNYFRYGQTTLSLSK